MAIYIVTHKPFYNQADDYYKTILVGAYKGHIFGDVFDDDGDDNISIKNQYYCELTGLYWLWKNAVDDVIGIVHYRRYFAKGLKKTSFLTKQDVEKILNKYDVILPNKMNIFESVKDQFAKSYECDPALPDLIKEIVEKYSPDMIPTYDKVMNGNEVYFCNMMISSWEIYREYCEWLFTILFEIEKKVDMSNYTDYQKRLYGFVSERLLTVWVEYKKYKIFEVGMVNLESNEGKLKEFLKAIRRVYSFRFNEGSGEKRLINAVRMKQFQNKLR